jgi:hypothetical protein
VAQLHDRPQVWPQLLGYARSFENPFRQARNIQQNYHEQQQEEQYQYRWQQQQANINRQWEELERRKEVW